ncbi:hypothetical protein [Escherichia coli]|nr:hypothetical protein [Escherichia coli]
MAARSASTSALLTSTPVPVADVPFNVMVPLAAEIFTLLFVVPFR